MSANDWIDIASVPMDGTSVWLKLETGFVVSASWQTGFMTSGEEDCGGWVADDSSNYPDCWSEGICWGVNAEESRSAHPVSWMPFETETSKAHGTSTPEAQS